MATDVHDATERSRYEVTVDGDLAGFAAYEDRGDGARVFTHTEVLAAYEGRGVGGALARGALDDARTRGLAVVPRCPFVRGWIERHPEFADLVVA
jgi:predicted GNAT family acetyltransferase